MKRLVLEPDRWECTLRECPSGFFVYEGQLCFKTQYGPFESVGPVNIPGNEIQWKMAQGRSDVYNSAGEHFHGPEKEDTIVQPVVFRWEEYDE